MLICRTGAERSEEMCGRNSLSLCSSERTHCDILNPIKKKVPNVNQKMGKYLTHWDYPERQINITVFRNAFAFESNISLPDFHNKDAMSCKVYEPSLAFYRQRQSFGTNDRPII